VFLSEGWVVVRKERGGWTSGAVLTVHGIVRVE
jgi:hypothetical protein